MSFLKMENNGRKLSKFSICYLENWGFKLLKAAKIKPLQIERSVFFSIGLKQANMNLHNVSILLIIISME